MGGFDMEKYERWKARRERDDYIPIDKCKDGYVYGISARSGGVGIWNEKTKGFDLSRYKFGDNFVFEEHHWDCEAFATAKPFEEIEKAPQFKNEEEKLAYLNKKEKELNEFFEGI